MIIPTKHSTVQYDIAELVNFARAQSKRNLAMNLEGRIKR